MKPVAGTAPALPRVIGLASLLLAERALCVASPVRYPWGPPRRRYPCREHALNAAGLVLARGAERMGVAWSALPLATVSAPRGKSPRAAARACAAHLIF